MSTAPTFGDPAVEAAYQADGYATITLFPPDEAARLADRWAPLVRTEPDRFKATLYDDDLAYRTEVDQALRPTFAAALAPHLHQQRAFIANLLVKPPGGGTELGVHQDWTFVDEATSTSATVWCPLVDVDEQNGTLVLFRGSHLLGPSHRGSPRLPSPFDGLEAEIHDHHGTAVPCAAGQAVVYDHRVVHWSGPNLGATTRLAVGVGIAPEDATLVHLHAAPDGRVTRYQVPDDFLHDLQFGQAPVRHTGASPVEVAGGALRADQLGPPTTPAAPSRATEAGPDAPRTGRPRRWWRTVRARTR